VALEASVLGRVNCRHPILRSRENQGSSHSCNLVGRYLPRVQETRISMKQQSICVSSELGRYDTWSALRFTPSICLFFCLSFPVSYFGVRLIECMGQAYGVTLLRTDTTGTFLHSHGVFDRTCMARGPYLQAYHTYSGPRSIVASRSLFWIHQ
jgi:hypothetical protein